MDGHADTADPLDGSGAWGDLPRGHRLVDGGPVTLAVGLAVALAGIALGAWVVRKAGDQRVGHPRAHNGRSVRLYVQPSVVA